MSTVINFGGRTVIEPGVYAITQAQVNSIPQNFSSGNVMIIDNGSGFDFGGGSGVDGEQKSGLDSVYSFDNLEDFRAFVRGGILWDVADYLFNPLLGTPGVSKLMIARAATTSSSSLTYTFNGALSVPTYSYVASGSLPSITTMFKKVANGKLFAGVNGDVYVSTDNGATWTSGGATISGNVYQITSTLNGNLYAGTDTGVYVSTDDGGTWTAVNTGLGAGPVLSIAGTNAVTNIIYAATSSGLYKSSNAGATWTITAMTQNVNAVAVDSAGKVYTSSPYVNVFKSVNAGTTFTVIATGLPLHMSFVLVQQISVNPLNQNVYIGTASQGIYKTVNAGATWTQQNVGLSNLNVRCFDFNSSGYIFAATALGIAQSVNGGASWIDQNNTLPVSFSSTFVVSATQFLVIGTNAVGAYITNVVTTGSSPDGGVVTIKTKNEGAAANGVITSGEISLGYGAKMMAGTIDTSKFIIEFYEGTYKGLDPDGDDYGGVSQYNSHQLLIARSIEFNNISDLISWMQTDYSFAARFILSSSSVNGSGALAAADLTAHSSILTFSGGATNYTSAALDELLSVISEVDNSFFLADEYAAQAQGLNNTKIMEFMISQSEFDKSLVIGGGNDETDFLTNSIATARYYDRKDATIVHSGFKINKLVGAGLKTLPSFYHAACVVGREAGLAPQTSLTFKAIRPTIFNHQLKKSDREFALQNGVLHNRFVPGIGFVINQGINSLQRNTQMVNPDGTSCEKSIMRIAAQLNKELTLNMRPLFIGGNLFTASPADVKSFIEGYLIQKTASTNQDNLIISFKNVTVKQVQDYYQVSYKFGPNSPINKIFSTGFIIDNNLSA